MSLQIKLVSYCMTRGPPVHSLIFLARCILQEPTSEIFPRVLLNVFLSLTLQFLDRVARTAWFLSFITPLDPISNGILRVSKPSCWQSNARRLYRGFSGRRRPGRMPQNCQMGRSVQGALLVCLFCQLVPHLASWDQEGGLAAVYHH